MLKNIGSILICLLVLSCVAQQGSVKTNDSGAGKSDEIVIKALAHGDKSNDEGRNWIRIVEAFEKENPDIRIDYDLFYDNEYHERVASRLASGDVPHIAYMGADPRWGKPWNEAGQQFDHRPYIDPEYYDLNLIPSMGPNGEIFVIPLSTSNITSVLFMNKSLVESLGFSIPRTYEDLVGMVEKTRAKGLKVVAIDGADAWAWDSCLLSFIVARMSGDPFWVWNTIEGKSRFTDKAFIDSLDLISRMARDGVISTDVLSLGYVDAINYFNNQKSLFLAQGQWASGGIALKVADNTLMLSWPRLPGEKDNMAGSVSAAIMVGYGITKVGGSDERIRNASLRFIKYYNSEKEVTQRLREHSIVAPILKNYKVPADFPNIIKQRVALACTAKSTIVIDQFIGGSLEKTLDFGAIRIIKEETTPEELAAELQKIYEESK